MWSKRCDRSLLTGVPASTFELHFANLRYAVEEDLQYTLGSSYRIFLGRLGPPRRHNSFSSALGAFKLNSLGSRRSQLRWP